MRFQSLVAFAVLVGACASRPTPAPVAVRLPLETRWFSFHSNMWVNLHHFLYVTARARSGMDASRRIVVASLADTVGFGALSESERNAWNSALGYYQHAVATRDVVFDSSLVAVNDRLAELERASTLRGSGLDSALVAALDGAAPVYRRLWWPRHDALNQRWTAAVVPLLARHGDTVAAQESSAFHTKWSPRPVRVDVGAYTNWAGAYTTDYPPHVNTSSTGPNDEGTVAFETLFHEVLHTMDRTLFDSTRAAFRAHGKLMPRSPTHPFIFYTAGELTRRRFTGYVPFAKAAGLWENNQDFARMLPLLQAHWQPHLEGRLSLTDALARIAEAW